MGLSTPVEDVQARALALAETLLGTCETLPDWVIEEPASFHTIFDAEISLCETCEWWVETCEVDEDGNCEQCATYAAEEPDR